MKLCYACSENLEINGEMLGYIEGTKFKILECKSCGASFADPHTSNQLTYEYIYKNKDTTPGYSRYFDFSQKIKHTVSPLKYLASSETMYNGLKILIDDIKINNISKALDVGCGYGYLTYALNKYGLQTKGIDISKEAISNAISNYGNYFINGDFFKIDNINDKFDLICMLEIIEHVDDPKKYIDKAWSLLNPGGVLYISTPNKNFYKKKLIWESDIPEVHISLFTESSIKKMFEGKDYISLDFINSKFHNFLHSQIFTSINRKFSCASTFTANGERLYATYKKSNVRLILEKYHLYEIANTFRYLFENIYTLIFKNRHFEFTLSRSRTMCIAIKKTK